jgi:hypothetical protein
VPLWILIQFGKSAFERACGEISESGIHFFIDDVVHDA